MHSWWKDTFMEKEGQYQNYKNKAHFYPMDITQDDLMSSHENALSSTITLNIR